ncbi:MAG: PCMD domain-containing protein [Bacteroidales bacterium]|nr:PCMD domain-containing protein [Bacteroidales bacterium]
MKRIIPVFFICFYGMLVFAQSQLENSGFEEWENVGLPQPEPVNWSSIKTTRSSYYNSVAPVVWFRSDDAHSGNYSVMLKNIATIGDIIATGTITSGRIHSHIVVDSQYVYTDVSDDRWHSTFTTRPDSLAGWYKYYPVNDDSVQIKVLLHRGIARIPEEGIPEDWIGIAFYRSEPDTVDQWSRFSVPFEYFSDEYPEYALAVLSSGNGFYAKENSILYIDDLEMIYKVPVGFSETHTTSFSVYIDRFRNLQITGASVTDFELMRIIDMTGRTVWVNCIDSETVKLPYANLNRGIYMISLENKSGRFIQKIIIQ